MIFIDSERAIGRECVCVRKKRAMRRFKFGKVRVTVAKEKMVLIWL